MSSPEVYQKVVKEALPKAWEAIQETVRRYQRKDKHIKFRDDYNSFAEGFLRRYTLIMDTYMKDDVLELDRHKIISIMIVVCIDDEIITYSGERKDLISLAPYTIAVEVGLNWMLKGLNRELGKSMPGCMVNQYFMPAAFMCHTSYFEIFCRNLYYAKNHWNGLNPLDIAERLYLLEYVTLQHEGIQPSLLQNYPQRKK